MKPIFSSWQDKVVDNRGKPEDSWEDSPDVKLPDNFDEDRTLNAFIGWGGLVLLKAPYDVVEMAYSYAAALQTSSCGRCFPCRIGTKVMEDLIERILDGKASVADLDELTNLCDSITKNSKCGIGQLGPAPIMHTLEHFKEDYMEYINGNRKRPGYSYPFKMTAPCTVGCPTGMDIPRYIEQVKDADFTGCLETVRKASPMANSLGRACFHPCEDNCRRDNVDKSLAICKLKRVAWDYVNDHAIEDVGNPNKHTRDEKIAVIGAGPAGLSCAYYLLLDGFHVTVFEKLDVPGGAAYTGIPQYRIPKDLLEIEADYIRKLGGEIKYGVNFGKDETFASLREKGYKAFFLGTGGDLSKAMRVKGEHDGYEGVYGGIEILQDIVMNTRPYDTENAKPLPKPKRVLVIGGGNTAMDCVRSFIRLGAEDVRIVYRRTKKELPADPHEIAESEDEGVVYNFLLAPTKIIAKKGKFVGLECQKMELGEPDESGRRRPVAIKGSEHVIEADCIISAIGQDCDIGYLEEEPTVEKTSWSTIITNEDTYQTAVPDVFAGGDVVSGPLNLVTAVGHARRAAQGIAQFLKGEKIELSEEQNMEKLIASIGAYDPREKVAEPSGRERVPMPICDRESKIGSFKEVELGYPQEQAMDEASRCMRCYIVGMASVTGNSNGGGK